MIMDSKVDYSVILPYCWFGGCVCVCGAVKELEGGGMCGGQGSNESRELALEGKDARHSAVGFQD